MDRFPSGLRASLVACSIPGAVIALFATAGAWLQWGGLSFSDPIYYATLAVAAWCPVNKIIIWRLWRRDANTCLTCRPARTVGRRLSPITHPGRDLAPSERTIEE